MFKRMMKMCFCWKLFAGLCVFRYCPCVFWIAHFNILIWFGHYGTDYWAITQKMMKIGGHTKFARKTLSVNVEESEEKLCSAKLQGITSALQKLVFIHLLPVTYNFYAKKYAIVHDLNEREVKTIIRILGRAKRLKWLRNKESIYIYLIKFLKCSENHNY